MYKLVLIPQFSTARKRIYSPHAARQIFSIINGKWSSPQQAAGILSGIAPKLASPFYRAEALGEGRPPLQQAAEYPGEGERAMFND